MRQDIRLDGCRGDVSGLKRYCLYEEDANNIKSRFSQQTETIDWDCLSMLREVKPSLLEVS